MPKVRVTHPTTPPSGLMEFFYAQTLDVFGAKATELFKEAPPEARVLVVRLSAKLTDGGLPVGAVFTSAEDVDHLIGELIKARNATWGAG